MTPIQTTELLHGLSDHAMSFQEICVQVRAAGSAWTAAQVRLLLSHLSEIQHDQATDRYHRAVMSETDTLVTAILDAVRSFAGKPVPPEQVRARLPNHFTTTNEQILALARAHPPLDVFGPGLLRLSSHS